MRGGQIVIKEVSTKDLQNPIQGFDTERQNRLVIEREVLPIIFVPGIMGSRLGLSQSDKVWDPDSDWFMLTTYGRRKATAERKKAQIVGAEFRPDYLQVISKDKEHNTVFADEIDTTREKRGWGGISWRSYGDILKVLQTREWDQSVNLFYEFPVHAFGYNWTASNGLAGKQLAAYIDQVLGEYPGRKCNKVILVTHSMGGLVARAACLLNGAKEKVLGVVHGVQPANGSPAAYWRMKGGFERPHTIPDLDFMQWFRNPVKMFNHVKGEMVQSALLGVPFTNFKIGKGHITAWVLGTDGEEVTALLGNMPGGLQLLPNKHYKNNEGCERWLELIETNGNKIALPISNPYKEIYLNRTEFFRLVNPEWLNPGDSVTAEGFERNSWKLYTKYLSEAEHFHDTLARLEEKVHPETYQFYASGIANSDRVVFTRAEDSLWEKFKQLIALQKNTPNAQQRSGKSLVFSNVKGVGNPLIPVVIDAIESMASGSLLRPPDWLANRGGYRDRVDANGQPGEEGELQLVTMQLPDGAGDGTVPESSARALKLDDDTQRTFCIGDKMEFEASFVDEKAKRLRPQCKVDFDEGFFDRAHEPIYNTKSAQFITFAAIENICRREIRRKLEMGE